MATTALFLLGWAIMFYWLVVALACKVIKPEFLLTFCKLALVGQIVMVWLAYYVTKKLEVYMYKHYLEEMVKALKGQQDKPEDISNKPEEPKV